MLLALRQMTFEFTAINRRSRAGRGMRPSLVDLQTIAERTLYDVARSFLSAYMDLMLDVDMQCHGLLPDGPKILAVNHPTSMDPFYILTLLREPVSVLVTAAAFNRQVIGPLLRATGHIPAVRGSAGGTVEAVVRQIESGRTVAIFPEGALSPPGGFHRPHSGLARVALRTGVPVIPVGIGLQYERIHVTETNMDGKKVTGHFYTGGPYAITLGRPLYIEGDPRNREDVKISSNRIMKQICSLAHESQSRIQRSNSVMVAAQNHLSMPAGAH